MKSKKTKLLFLVIGLLAIISLSSLKINASSYYDVSEITKTPEILQKDQNMTVEIVFSNDSDVDVVRLLICTISPNFVCEPQPITMGKIANLTYSADFLVEYDEGTEVGYHIQIIYLNASQIIIPDSAEFLGMEIIEPVTDQFFFKAGVVGGISETGCCGILSSVVAVAASTIIFKKKKHN
jgi:hypothetical protein